MSEFDSTIPPDLLEAILNDPDKRQFVLKLLNEAKSTLDNSTEKRKQYCESPIQLYRRRALEKLNGNTSDTSSDSDLGPPPGPKIPHEKLLEGVVAFVDVRRDHVDKSAGIKLVMESMGAVIKDKICRGVTHVVFKDADYITFQAARLLNCHLVSVLWVDAIRKKGYRVPEKNYPAFGGDDGNASILCSQIQKEFDDIIKEEKSRNYDYRKTSTLAEMKQNRTLLTAHSSKSSYGTAKSSTKDSSKTDSEIVEILSNLPTTGFLQISSPELTSDNSDCGVVNGHTSGHLKNKFNCIETNRSLNTTTTTDISSDQSKSLISGKRGAKSTAIKTMPVIEKLIEESDITRTILTDKSTNISSDITRTISTDKLDVLPTKSTRSSRSKSCNLNNSSNIITRNRTKSRSNFNSSDIASGTPSNNGNISTTSDGSLDRNSRSSRSKSRNNLNILSNIVLQTPSKNYNPETSDSTRTLSTEKSLNVSTNKSSIGENNESEITMSSLRLSLSSKDKENSELLSNLSDKRKLTQISDKKRKSKKNYQPKVVLKRHLINPGEVVCTPKDDDLERAERIKEIKAMEIKKKILQKNHKIDNNNDNKSGKRKRNTNFDNSSDSSESTIPQRSQHLSITPKLTNQNKIIDNNYRRSSLEFQNSSEKNKKPRTRIDPSKAPSIVCTRFHRYEVVDFIEIVKQLGVFHVELQVTKKTTHLIAGEPKRTINMLRAISRGCWILKREWLDKSLKNDKWLPEEDYEFTDFSPAVQQCRLERQAFGPNYTTNIFEGCGQIFVTNNTTPPQHELRELIEICKGKVTKVYRNADIAIGQLIRSVDVCVTEMWVLDSIMENRLKSFRKYRIKDSNSPDF